MKIKLLLDEDIHPQLASVLRKRGYDAIHVQELERKGKTDFEQLDHAVEEKRCIVTFNVRDFVILHNKCVQQEKEHYGIIVSKQRSVGEALRRILKILLQFSQETMKNRLEFL